MKLALVKPDHLGDLILSRGAIRALLSAFPSSHLFVAPKNMALARYLFPSAELRPVYLPHLNKGGETSVEAIDLVGYDQVVMFRQDNIINFPWMDRRANHFIMTGDTHMVHQSILDYRAARMLRGKFDIDEAYFGNNQAQLERKARRLPKTIGLSIGSGFHANSWPVRKWTELVGLFLPKFDEVVILCGAADAPMAKAILACAGHPRNLTLEIGSSDIGSFLARVQALDLVVATDGGTAHLCSLVAPTLSVFGPSPYKRYAPFGMHNRLITRDMDCSPCCQYAAHLVNTCLSNECMVAIDVAVVDQVVARPVQSKEPAVQFVSKSVKVIHGASHLDRESLCHEIDG